MHLPIFLNINPHKMDLPSIDPETNAQIEIRDRSPIQDKFLEFDMDATINLIKQTKRFQQSDMGFAYFVSKYFMGNTDTYKFMAMAHSDPISALISLNQHNQFLPGDRVSQNDVVNSTIPKCKDLVDKFLRKEFIFRPKTYIEQIPKYVDIENLELLALSGSKEGADHFIEYLQKNLHVAFRSEATLRHMKTAAAYGILGQMYLYGVNVKKNLTVAKHYLTIGAKQGDINSLNGLGDFYLDCKNDSNSAISCYIKSASKGSNEGAWKLTRALTNNHSKYSSFRNNKDEEGYYLPAVLDKLTTQYQRDNISAASDHVITILSHCEEIQRLEDLNKKFFQNKEYEKSFILSLFLDTCGAKNGLKNLNMVLNSYKSAHKFPLKYFHKRNTKILSPKEMDELYFNHVQQIESQDGLLAVSDCYKNGIGVQKDDEIAFANLCLSKNMTFSPESSLKMFQAYECGRGVEKSLKKALRELDYLCVSGPFTKLFCFYKKRIIRSKISLSRFFGARFTKIILIPSLFGFLINLIWRFVRNLGSEKSSSNKK